MSGQIRTTGRCRPCGSGGSWGPGDCRDIFGDEWDYIGENGCNYDCKVAGASPGTQARCQMVRYNGNQTACCFGNTTTGTCNPSHNVTNPQCDRIYANYCAQGDRIIRDPKCLNWRNVRPDASRATIQNYCVANLDAIECRQWCKQKSDSGDGVCDGAVSAWCDSNPSDPYCACIKSPLMDPKFGINPKCNDRKCIDTGYITQNMKNTNCPDITNCDVQTKMLNSGVQLAGVTVNQNCGKPTETTPTAKDTIPKQGMFAINTQWLIVIIFLFICVIAVIFITVRVNYGKIAAIS